MEKPSKYVRSEFLNYYIYIYIYYNRVHSDYNFNYKLRSYDIVYHIL